MNRSSAATSTNAIAPAKSHYVVLDGLRGVASLLVVMFHIFEAWNGGDPAVQIINHGYLAVDFFFLLSGFVIAYAYDDRWKHMRTVEFFKRRLIRLQPMVIIGSAFGAALFYFAAGPLFPEIAAVPLWKVLLTMLVGFTLLPVPPSMDIRGWQEMHPLNGPAWSLFYEYVGNVLYAAIFRRISLRSLGVLTFLSAILLAQLAVFGGSGDMIGGWDVTAKGVHIGLARLLFPFCAGILLMRLGKRIRTKHAFAVCSLLLVIALALPRFGGRAHRWENGLYEAIVILFIFPLIVAAGAGEKSETGTAVQIARFFGGLSYPLYITHYPLVYIYTEWVVARKPGIGSGVAWGAALLLAAVGFAYASLKLYDEPVRRWLSRRFLPRAA